MYSIKLDRGWYIFGIVTKIPIEERRITVNGEKIATNEKTTMNEEINNDLRTIKTISDYIYFAIRDSMKRRVDRKKRREVLKLAGDIDLSFLLRPYIKTPTRYKSRIDQFIDANSYMSDACKQDLRYRLSSYVDRDDYDCVAFFYELTKTETNITIDELRKYLKTQKVPEKKVPNTIGNQIS